MYLAMDDLGMDNLPELAKYSDPLDKWHKIAEIAEGYGMRGIQLNSKMYQEELGLSLDKIPGFMHRFRYTWHVGGLFQYTLEDDRKKMNEALKQCMETASSIGIEDVSFHPPFTPRAPDAVRQAAKDHLRSLAEHWLPRFSDIGITFSIETHVSGEFFAFNGIRDYAGYVSDFHELGVLIDISHNCYDGYSVGEILAAVGHLKITGLHLSDALSGEEFQKGTHLPIGKGEVDFKKLLSHFQSKPDIYGALEIKGPSRDIADSAAVLQELGINEEK